ncbi:MAG: lysylphosphatidylglycerol synthase domain-containing protein [Myxococcota bacterium]
MTKQKGISWSRALHLFFLTLGVVLLGVLIWRLDASALLEQVLAAGWVVLPAFAAYIGSNLVSTLAWREAIPPAHRVPFLTLFSAFSAGHAVNVVAVGGAGTFVTGSLASRQTDGGEVMASLVSYSYLTMVSVFVFTLIGPALCFVWLDLPLSLTGTLLGVSIALCVGAYLLRVLLRRGLVGGGLRLLQKLPFVRMKDPEALREKAEQVDARVRSFRGERPRAFRQLVLYLAAARMFQTAEAWFLLQGLFPDEPLGELALLALLVQSTAQLIGWTTTFIPGRVGVAEGGMALLFEFAGLDPATGLALGLLRRVRKIVGIGLGLALGAHLEASTPAPDDANQAA